MPDRRPFALVLAGLVVGSCGGSPHEPSATAVPTDPGRSRPAAEATVPTPEATRVAGLRLMLGSPDGTAWSVTEPDQPWSRTPLVSTAAGLELGPSSPDGSVLVATADAIAVARIDGSTLRTTASLVVPPGHPLVPACHAGDGIPVFAEAETLALVAWTANGIRPLTAVPFTTGQCAPLAGGRTLVVLDGGALVAVDGDGRSSPLHGVLGHRLSGGGGLVAITDPSSEAGTVVVRRATVTGGGTLGGEIGRVEGDARERIVDARLSPDGRWLAVTAERTAATGPGARLRLYLVDPDGLVRVDEMSIDVGTRIRLLPGP